MRRTRKLSLKTKEVKALLDKIALILIIIGGLNWGLVGLFQLDVIAWVFGGSAALVSRILYILVALAALWCISMLFRHENEASLSHQ